MATFSDMKYALDEIAKHTSMNKAAIERARKSLVDAQYNLNAMQTKYSGVVSDINQAAIENPGDVAYEMAKSEKDKLVADFQALKAYAENLIIAFDSV